MALQKTFKSEKKINYAFINQMNYIKDQMINLNIILEEKALSWKPVKKKIETGKDEKGKPVYTEYEDTVEPKKRITEMSFTIPLKDPQTGKTDELFTVDKMSKKDNNLIKNCYLWLQNNVNLFSDWEDC